VEGDFAVNTWGEVLVVLGIIGAFLGVLDWRIKQSVANQIDSMSSELKKDIEKMTQPIQPGYRNGGESLADLAHEVRRMSRAMGADE
jgi:hypothetical protein